MEKLLLPPAKIKEAVFGHYFASTEKEGSWGYHDWKPELFMVVDSRTGIPQHFWKCDDPSQGFGGFMNAEHDPGEGAPACIFDMETAYYLIAQDAIHASLCKDRLRDEVHTNRIYRLVPVFGAMIPNCLPKTAAK